MILKKSNDNVTAVSGSFRDPAGRVFDIDGRILRTVTEVAKEDYNFVRESGLIADLVDSEKLVPEKLLDRAEHASFDDDVIYVLEHPRLESISYPYEWSFPLLKSAALHQLDILLESLKYGVTLSDATAYNIQFNGIRPVFIDHLSFRKYEDGEYWSGHKQFCDQFLNPLLLRSLLGVSHNSWYRGSLEGISAEELNPLLKWKHKLKMGVLAHVVMQAKLQQRAGRKTVSKKVTARPLPLRSFQHILEGLRNQISRLTPKDRGKTVWGDYTEEHSYEIEETQEKKSFIAEFSQATNAAVAWDLGCNTGEYSQVLLENGTNSVVGFDFDQGALEKAYARAEANDLNLLPLFFDAANPSPNQGWAQLERSGFSARTNADAMIALAFVHHLAITRNIPLGTLVKWLVHIAPSGVIEFIPKTDPMVQELLSLRKDIFPNYNESHFQEALERYATVVKKKVISKSGRVLYWYTTDMEKP